MAKILGESGRYVAKEAVKQRMRILLQVCLTLGLLGVILGLDLSVLIPTAWISTPLKYLLPVLAIAAMAVLFKWSMRQLEILERRRVVMQRGLAGESLVAEKLTDFPDDFCVINDLSTPYGNLDHVIVGPTGVFVLDAKNWRGVVTPDGKGELLLNGRPTDKPLIRQFVGRMLGIKDKVRALVPDIDPYYQAVFVFTAARVQANWGSTGSVHCITDDQLSNYIVQKEFGKKLKPTEVQAIAQAFLGLALMEKEFSNTAPKSRGPTNFSLTPKEQWS